MDSVSFQNMCTNGMWAGVGIAVAPVTVTAAIACSRILFVNIIANIAVRILTGGAYSATVTGMSFVQVPLLWKASFILAGVGGSLAALSALAMMIHNFYLYKTRAN